MSDPAIERLRLERARLHQGGGPERLAKQRAAGKLTARERLALLYDPDTFQEWNLWVRHRSTHPDLAGKELPAEGVVTGVGSVDGRPVYVASQDFTVAGGSIGEAGAARSPSSWTPRCSTGASLRHDQRLRRRPHPGRRRRPQRLRPDLLSQRPALRRRPADQRSSPAPAPAAPPTPRRSPTSSSGRAATASCTSPAPRSSSRSPARISRPKQLGGVESHAYYSGIVHFIAEDDEDAIEIARRLLSSCRATTPRIRRSSPAARRRRPARRRRSNSVIPDDPREPYDMREVIYGLVDRRRLSGSPWSTAPRIIVIGFARITGCTVGIVANQPMVKAGVLDIDASDKARALHPLLQRLQHPAGHLRRRPRLPARRRAGATAASSATAPRCSSPMPRRPCPRSPSSCARPTAAPTSRCAPRPWAPTASAPGPPPRSPSWAPKARCGSSTRKEIEAARIPTQSAPAASTSTMRHSPTRMSPRPRHGRRHHRAGRDPRLHRAGPRSPRTKRELRPQKKHGLIPL